MREFIEQNKTKTLPELAELMIELRSSLDEAKAIATELEKKYDYVRTVLIPPIMEAQSISSFKMASGKGIRVQDEVFVSMKVDNLEQMKRWLEVNGESGLVKETIHPGTLKAFVTSRVKAGQDWPQELVSLTIVPKARFY